MVLVDVVETREALVDEDDGDESRECFLREAGEVPDEDAALETDDDEADDEDPETDPDASREELNFVSLKELRNDH